MALTADVAGYEGLYLVTDEGDVISIERLKDNGRGVFVVPERKMSQATLPGGYKQVSLFKDGERHHFRVHRLVAEAFLENPDNLPEVNHKDEDPSNNKVENLEWCSRQYNIDYSKSKPVVQVDSYGEEVARYKSISHAARITGISRTNINNALCGWSETAGGFRWEYKQGR